MDAQFKKGILDSVVLSILEKKQIYGYGLEMEMASLMDVSGNTLYPLLRRLEKDDYLDTYMHVSEQGRRRKYYRITDKGRSHLKELRKDWKAFKEVADRLIGGDVDE